MRDLALTNSDRVLWPASGTTKGDLVAYYRDVGPVLVPHLRDRPLMLGRWPEGVGARGWGQLECRGRPSWMATYPLRLRSGEVVDVCVVNEVDALVWLANQGVVELHPYLMRASAPERPIALVFDLDPGPPATVVECAEVAVLLRERLMTVGLDPAVKTSGGSGLHLAVAIDSATFAETKAFAHRVAAELARDRSDLVVDRPWRALRRGRVFIDWSQNDARKQTIAPYSLRAADEPRVSLPVSWRELERPETLAFTIDDVRPRLDALGDLFANALGPARALPAR